MMFLLRTSAVWAFVIVSMFASDTALAAGAGDAVVNVNNNTIVKLDAADGSVQWSVSAKNDGTLSVDPADLSVYTTGAAHGTTYKFTADGTPNRSGFVNASSYQVTPKAAVNSFQGVSDFNPASGTQYRSDGATLYQVNGLGVATSSIDLSTELKSVDALAVQPWEGGYVYAGSATDSKIVVVDPATNNVVTTFDTAISPRHIAISSEGGTIYIADGQNPFVIAYTRTGALSWINLNVGGAVTNLAAAKRMVATAPVTSCGLPTLRISSDRNSLHKGESAIINIGYGSGSLQPCNPFTAYFIVKTKAVNNTDFTFLDANNQDATQVGGTLQGPLTLTHLYSSRKKTLPVNITLKKDPAYYTGNTKITVQLLAK